MAAAFDLALLGGNELDLSGGQLNFVTGSAWVRQAVETTLKMVKGEWFLDPKAGLPLFENILGKNPNLGLIRSVLSKTVLGVDHVTGIQQLTLAIDRAARRLDVAFVVSSEYGPVTGAVALGG